MWQDGAYLLLRLVIKIQKDRKKEHKKVVKYLRLRNKQLSRDEYVGINRFRIDLWSEDMYRFSDGSGLELYFIFRITDNITGNGAYFMANNFDYLYRIFEYANDFLIRCSDGRSGHYPPLHYIAYDIHEVIPYKGKKDNPTPKEKYENGVINTYNWTRWNLFERSRSLV